MHEAQKVLAAVTEAHSSTRSALIIGRATAHIERHHTLILVPDIDHTVEFFLGRTHGKAGQQTLPIGTQLFHSRVKLFFCFKRGQHGIRFFFIDDAVRSKLLFHGVFHVSQAIQQTFFFARGKRYFRSQRGNGRPPCRHTSEGSTFFHGNGFSPPTELPQKAVSVRVKPGNGGVDRIERVVVTAFTIFRLVINRAPFYFHFADIPVPLEVGGIVHGVPQAPFHGGIDRQCFFLARLVAKDEFLHFHIGVHRHHRRKRGADAVLFALEDRVSQPVMATVEVQFRPHGEIGGAPNRFSVADIKRTSAVVRRHVVVPKTRDPTQFCVTVKTIPATRVADQREKTVVAQIVDPRQGRLRHGDHIFFRFVVKKPVFHCHSVFYQYDSHGKPWLLVTYFCCFFLIPPSLSCAL